MLHLILLALFLAPVFAQIPLPKPPWLPQGASEGAKSTSQDVIPNRQWSSLLGSLLYFYEAQRSGKLPPTNRVTWRNDSCLNDGKDNNIDLSGGYYDAGDYIKVTYPLSFTLMSICWGATDFGRAYDIANQTPYLDDMLRWGLDWLIKAHPSNNTLYVLVSEAQTNYTYWGGDLRIPTPRPSFQINATSPGTDAAAAASAAFSACSSLYAAQAFPPPYFAPATLANSTYAHILLTHAQQLYTFAQNATGGHKPYTTSIPPSAGKAYNSTTYAADLVLAAAFLARAESSPGRYVEASRLWLNNKLGGDALTQEGAVFNWASKSAGVPILLTQMALNGGRGEVGQDFDTWSQEATKWADAIVAGKGQASLTPGGLLFFDGDSDDASLNPALNAAMLMWRYAHLLTSAEKKSTYMKFAQSQLDYVLGKNPMSAPYVVGINPNSPSNPHSALASGGNNISQIDTSPPQEAYVLYGAVVGGPNKRDRFWDVRSDWPQTEVSLDYNAPLLTLTAMHLSNTSTDNARDPFYASLQPGAFAARKPKGLPCDPAFPNGCGPGAVPKDGKIALGVIISVIGVSLIVGAIWWTWEVYRRGTRSSSTFPMTQVPRPGA